MKDEDVFPLPQQFEFTVVEVRVVVGWVPVGVGTCQVGAAPTCSRPPSKHTLTSCALPRALQVNLVEHSMPLLVVKADTDLGRCSLKARARDERAGGV